MLRPGLESAEEEEGDCSRRERVSRVRLFWRPVIVLMWFLSRYRR